ncbi:MAG: hypothetical protein JWM30_828 [Burkholderia sp.]|jgi:hypothetical protein|nr:hypothetical protein [Burkholderia sp.]
MTSSTMTYAGNATPSAFRTRTGTVQPVVSLRDWFDVLRQALAMANALPTTGRVSAKDVARIRVMADLL